MNNIDWSQLRKAEDIKAEAEEARLAPLIAAEIQWAEQERKCAAEQLEAIEDGESIVDTERQWRDYRTQVRAWKEGAAGYPDSSKRPMRPS